MIDIKLFTRETSSKLLLFVCLWVNYISDYLKNERLMFVADRLQEDWRKLGLELGFSMNRMDMVEIELPPDAKPDMLGYAMLKTWRDEIKGKVSLFINVYFLKRCIKL